MSKGDFPSRADWPPGPWDDEPDHEEWDFIGLRCIIHRAEYFGQLNGYVIVPRGHPWFGLAGESIDTHWGITWAAPVVPWSDEAPPPIDLSLLGDREGEGEDARSAQLDALSTAEEWVLGFDTLHAYDSAPGMEALRKKIHHTNPQLGEYEPGGTYRTWSEVEAMVLDLAAQAAAASALDDSSPGRREGE